MPEALRRPTSRQGSAYWLNPDVIAPDSPVAESPPRRVITLSAHRSLAMLEPSAALPTELA